MNSFHPVFALFSTLLSSRRCLPCLFSASGIQTFPFGHRVEVFSFLFQQPRSSFSLAGLLSLLFLTVVSDTPYTLAFVFSLLLTSHWFDYTRTGNERRETKDRKKKKIPPSRMSLFGSVGAASTSAAQTNTTGDISKDVALNSPPEDGISDMCFSPASEHLAVASWDKKVRIYEINEQGQSEGKALFEHEAPVLNCCWAPVCIV